MHNENDQHCNTDHHVKLCATFNLAYLQKLTVQNKVSHDGEKVSVSFYIRSRFCILNLNRMRFPTGNIDLIQMKGVQFLLEIKFPSTAAIITLKYSKATCFFMISIFFELYFQGLIGNCFVRIRCFLNFIFKVWLGKFKICTPLGARVGGFFFSFSLHSVLRKRRKTTKPEWGVKKHTRQFASQHICCILIFVLYIHQVIYKEIHYLSFCAHSALQIYISEI